ncbi:site-specific integrase [Sulfurisoma sediminicola]|uniref:Phage integrase family protein n=1 Tax=Sulfurisoma sediminicola TaxID=1381557 RepID=A0A497XCH9_9PROT|nr:site-specific integrase [Sulfurisoma sediminicola]RLJ64623.1 phage integrase family protein [Sulfurisoma sediminicola]
MATITQLKTGRWQAVIRRKGHPSQSRTFPLQLDARTWARKIESEMDRGGFISAARAEGTTFKDLATAFEKDFAPYHYRAGGWQSKLTALRARLGDYSLVAITPQVLAKYRDDRLRDPCKAYKDAKSAPRISSATVKGELDLLSKVLDVGQKEFGIPLPAGNPVRQIRIPKGSRSRNRRLTADEWARLEAECKASGNPWLAPALALAVETAMRRGELLQLEWQHIDKQRRLAMLLDPDKIKNQEPRAVPLSSTAMATLEALPRAIGGRVIPIAAPTLWSSYRRALERAKISDFTWHDLRHEALSRLAERGDFSVLEMAAVSGHKTLQMLKRYTHLQAEKLARKLG